MLDLGVRAPVRGAQVLGHVVVSQVLLPPVHLLKRIRALDAGMRDECRCILVRCAFGRNGRYREGARKVDPHRFRGPVWLFITWVVHDIEEAVAFPDTCEYLARRTGMGVLRMTARQSWTAVGLMGVLIGLACMRGAATGGTSRLYRAVLAGLDAHVATHVGASAMTRRYTAGVATAAAVMLPGTRAASRELTRLGIPLTWNDYVSGAAVLLPAAFLCHALVRVSKCGRS